MKVDVFDKQSGKFLGTKHHVISVRTGQLYYIIEDEEVNEFHYHMFTYKLIITTE